MTQWVVSPARAAAAAPAEPALPAAPAAAPGPAAPGTAAPGAPGTVAPGPVAPGPVNAVEPPCEPPAPTAEVPGTTEGATRMITSWAARTTARGAYRRKRGGIGVLAADGATGTRAAAEPLSGRPLGGGRRHPLYIPSRPRAAELSCGTREYRPRR
ncbi:MAG: hypothetical protein E6J14_13050 [Chloroflexi bacterium]|nr:MAG: hypothetical protein E6J14_13050 [Chloroflexota bacterium]